MSARSIWGYRALFAFLCALILFVALLPFDVGEGRIPGPDLIVCLMAAWILRRPDYVPVWLLVPILFLADVLLMRPLGLWALIVFVMGEYLRRRVGHTETMSFWSECGLVAGCIATAFFIDQVALVILLTERPPLGGQIIHALATVVFYPAVAVFSKVVGVNRLAPGELDTLGNRG